MSKLPAHMSADEIVEEIKRLHDDVEHAAFRMGELCRLLLMRSRIAATRTASNEAPRRPERPRPGQPNTTPARRQEPAPNDAQRIATANVTFANAWLRLAGLVVQGVRRTKVADRSLESEKRDAATEVVEAKEKAARDERREERREARREGHRAGAPIADLMELYGKEIVDDAAR